MQHLDLRHVGREAKPLQPHAAAFHPHQALIAAAVGKYIIGNSSSPNFYLLISLGFSWWGYNAEFWRRI